MPGLKLRISHRLVAIFLLAVLLLPTNSLAQSTMDLVVHYVEGFPQETQDAYDVKAYLSALDADGNVIKDIEAEDFSATEDSQPVEIRSFSLVKDEPINIVLVVNNSRAMRGTVMDTTKEALKSFVASRNVSDSIALMTFNDVNDTVVDLTTDHQDVQSEIDHIKGIAETGACMYDAIYQAIQITASINSGRRAILVLTNTPDLNINGNPCSSVVADDVINAASQGSTRVPIYTIGLGEYIDEQDLTRIATLTGGRYQWAENSGELETILLRVSNQYDSEYVLEYTSYLAPGPHTLVVKVEYDQMQDQDSRSYLFPLFPTRLTFGFPSPGQEIGGPATVTVNVRGSGEPASEVSLEINGEAISTDSSAPFEFEVDFNNYAEGDLAITAIARGASGSELARATENIIVNYAATVAKPESGGLSIGTVIMIAGAVFAGFILLAVVILAAGKKKSRKKKRSSPSISQPINQHHTAEDIIPTPSAGMAAPAGNSDATIIEEAPAEIKKPSGIKFGSSETLGTLIVEFSDDATLVGHRFDITNIQTTIGRSADNDITFPKDSPISRRHAQIEARSDGLYINEVQTKDDSGVMKSPTFGTYVNEAPLAAGGSPLRNGDVIRLGKRVRLKFETQRSSGDDSSPTMDNIDLDKTIG